MKTKKIGCVNPCAIATLQDNAGNVIGTTLDTPNAIAYAMAVNEKVKKSVAHYQFFGDTITTREQLQDRFKWVINESATHKQFLKWA